MTISRVPDLCPWQEAMRRAIRDPGELCRVLRLPAAWGEAARPAADRFGLFVPREFAARMRPGDLQDPLLRQVLPAPAEMIPVPGFSADPVGDRFAQIRPGLLQKYAGRALLLVSGACAVHCRYCFRRHFPYSEIPKGIQQWEPALERLAGDATIDEVILSGGDPLTVTDGVLAELAQRLARIGHLSRLRLHTRLPVVIPQRVCPTLLEWLGATRLTAVVVLHINHPNEIDAAVTQAIERLQGVGAVLLNQAVLLRGVNDRPEVLERLCRELVNRRVVPYYLHQLDPVDGAAAFQVPDREAIELIDNLRSRLPGYAVPRLARERPGMPAKQVLR